MNRVHHLKEKNAMIYLWVFIINVYMKIQTEYAPFRTVIINKNTLNP